MKTRIHVVVPLLAIAATMLILVANNGFVYAQPCTATLSYPVIPTPYGNSNVPFVVPVSASCTTYYNQLYATGNAFDSTSNTGLGTASAVLASVNGGTQFSGQLGFGVLPTSPGDSVQISVSIYDNQGGNLLTQAGETVPVGAAFQQPGQQVTTTTVTVGQYPYYNPSPTGYQSPYQPNQAQYYQNMPQYQQQQYQGHHWYSTYYFSQALAQRSTNTNLFDYLVIIAIVAAVIISIVGLVLVVRRQPQAWYPVPPPPR
jgi:hypothetical protein